MDIAVTHYTKGEGVPFYPPMEDPLSVQDALADMFRRLLNGAVMAISGYNYGLVTYLGSDEAPTGSDTAIYGGLSPKLQDFLIRASKYWERSEELEPGTPAHEQFLRRRLIEDLDLGLSKAEMEVALVLDRDEFLVAVAMGIETGESIVELFRPTASAS